MLYFFILWQIGSHLKREAILPLDGFYEKLETIIDKRLNTSAMEKYLSVIAENSDKGIYLDSGTLVGRLAPGLNRQLGVLATEDGYR